MGGSPTSAAGSLAGFTWQKRRALIRLLRADPGETVQIEQIEDITLCEPSGEIIAAVQNKHALTPGKLTTQSRELWKSIGAKLHLISVNEIDFDDSYVIATTKEIGSQLRPLTNSATEGVKLLDQAASSSESETLEEIHDEWLSLSPEQKEELVGNLKIVSGENRLEDSFLDIKTSLRKKAFRDRDLEEASELLLGWFEKEIGKRLDASGCEFRSEEVLDKLTRIRDQFSQTTLPPMDTVEGWEGPDSVPTDPPTYVEQLRLIDEPRQGILRAVGNVQGTQNYREKIIQNNLLSKSFLKDFDDNLERNFHDIREGILLDGPDDQVEAGKRIKVETLQREAPLKGDYPPHGVRYGSYHRLANIEKIGWHPEFKELLDG